MMCLLDPKRYLKWLAPGGGGINYDDNYDDDYDDDDNSDDDYDVFSYIFSRIIII